MVNLGVDVTGTVNDVGQFRNLEGVGRHQPPGYVFFGRDLFHSKPGPEFPKFVRLPETATWMTNSPNKILALPILNQWSVRSAIKKPARRPAAAAQRGFK